MVKRLLLVLALCLIPVMAHATTVDTRFSGNTINMKAGQPESNGIYVVTFNTVTNHIILWNDGPTILEVDLRCISPIDGTRGYASSASCVVYLPAFGTLTPNTVELDFATKNLAFEMENGKAEGKVRYVVTGDWGDF